MGSLGESIASRFNCGYYPCFAALGAAALSWGGFGLALSLLIWLFNGGVVMLQATGLLPGGGLGGSSNAVMAVLTSYFFLQPFFTSLFLNLGGIHPLLAAQLIRRQAMVIFLTERKRPGLDRVVSEVDWADFIRREISAIPILRVPAFTVVLMLPQDLWLVASAFLMVIWGVMEELVLRPRACVSGQAKDNEPISK